MRHGVIDGAAKTQPSRSLSHASLKRWYIILRNKDFFYVNQLIEWFIRNDNDNHYQKNSTIFLHLI